MDNRPRINWINVAVSVICAGLALSSAISRTMRLCRYFPSAEDAFLWIALRLLLGFVLVSGAVWLLAMGWRQASAGRGRRKLRAALLWAGAAAVLAGAGLVLAGALTDTVRLCLRVPAAQEAIWLIELRLLVVFLAAGNAARLLLEKLRRRGAERRAREEENKALQDFERRLREWDE